jgi:hypothetical protein
VVIRNIERKGPSRHRDYYSVEITGDGERGKSTKKNQQRRRILHLVFDAPLGMKTNCYPF